MSLSLKEIDDYTHDLGVEAKAIKFDLFKMCWYMRGGITISEAYEMDIGDREIIGKIIEENLNTTKESGLPFF